MAALSLKDLIKQIRATKTAAQEREAIQKESARIRALLKEGGVEGRYNNIAKLLYIHMLGYPAHFGQIECLKLVVQSQKFVDKRLGYLGIMMLLDESQEVLTLVTNQLKNDMNHANMYIVGLALCTLGNIASQEMARDLCPEVEKHLNNSNPYIRKKAALCAVRILKKVPELVESISPLTQSIYNERNHGVLLSGITLSIEICQNHPETLPEYRKVVPTLLRLLKNLISTGFSPEHDVSGVTDPFLQVKILRLLRILGHGNTEASEAMTDILAQVATNTDSAKNVGNAILYETVLTIMEIKADNSLRVLAVNILGKFLANKDNNIRYVALTTLLKTIEIDNASVQRHRTTVLDCLKDPDSSIRRRALDLCFALINETNVRILARELVIYLESPDVEGRSAVAARICVLSEQYAPNPRWLMGIYIRVLHLSAPPMGAVTMKGVSGIQDMLRASDNVKNEELVSNFVRLVTNVPEMHSYLVRKLYFGIKGKGKDVCRFEALVCGGVWTLGEIGATLSTPYQAAVNAENANEDEDITGEVSESDMIGLMESLLDSQDATRLIKQYVLNAMIKLAQSFPSCTSRINKCIGTYRTHLDADLQQRAIEFNALSSQTETVRKQVLDRMPAIEGKPISIQKKNAELLDASSPAPSDAGNLLSTGNAPQSTGMDLMNDLFNSQPAPSQAKPVDLMADLFASMHTTTTPQHTASQQPQLLDDLFGSNMVKPVPQSAGATFTASSVYKKEGLEIKLHPSWEDKSQGSVKINTSFENGGFSELSGIYMQVAVPKSMKLQIMPPTATNLSPHTSATQQLIILNPGNEKLRLRLKVGFTSPLGQTNEVVSFEGFADFP